VVILRRKQVGNPKGFFDKNFDDYRAGFESRGELWLGLEALHKLTSERNYKLQINLTDFDNKVYTAVYDMFKVGPGDEYKLAINWFNSALSSLGDSFTPSTNTAGNLNGMKFSTRDRDQDKYSLNCAQLYGGGWWHNACSLVRLTGQHTDTKTTIDQWKQISYFYGGARGNTGDSWKEAEMLLVPV